MNSQLFTLHFSLLIRSAAIFFRILVYSLLSLILIQCREDPNVESTYGNLDHQKEATDSKSYLLPDMDHGLLQSPINILSKETEDEGKHNITFNYSGKINKVSNLGHTVQLDLEPGNTITADGNTYEFKQMHFHTPSEHLIDGVTYPMEMHVVNVMPPKDESDTPHYLVIAFLVKMGEENSFIKQFIDQIPKGAEEMAKIDFDAVKASPMMQKDPNDLINAYYHYMGSLTTPPYTESVFWMVHKKIFEASPDQIIRINEIEGDNARQIQSLNERMVESE